ncbi:DUF6314 family protein [Herbaspirillum sp. NPDC087042]|uniref:DUF6314 family protein n=1 Tax=Herbaspirillum sp. NPDC087042 TaxID=3364004 RepID=UPI0037F2834D
MAGFPPLDMPDLAAYFRGQWQFTRTIWEGGEDAQAEAAGEAVFRDGELTGQLIYQERGHLRMLTAPGMRPIAFSRLFDYRFGTDVPARLQVLFADGERTGQPYQDYLLRGNMVAPAADHLCGPDCYNAAYTLDGDEGFTMETFINGPKKRTRVLTRYQRQTDLSASPA